MNQLFGLVWLKKLFTILLLDKVLYICIDYFYNSDSLLPSFSKSFCNEMLCMAKKNVQYSFNDLMFSQITTFMY